MSNARPGSEQQHSDRRRRQVDNALLVRGRDRVCVTMYDTTLEVDEAHPS
jgi:hypothetical protein